LGNESAHRERGKRNKTRTERKKAPPAEWEILEIKKIIKNDSGKNILNL